jgi:hypothetical protein
MNFILATEAQQLRHYVGTSSSEDKAKPSSLQPVMPVLSQNRYICKFMEHKT